MIAPWYFLFIGLFLICGFFVSLRRRLVIIRTPRSKIGAAALGPVELKGFGVKAADQELLSPVAQVPCLFFRYRILKRKKRKGSSQYVQIYSEDSSHMPFIIKDETGEAWIYPMGSELISQRKEILHGGQYTLRTREALERLGRIDLAANADDYRLEEELLLPGDSIYALGFLHPTQSFLQNEVDAQIREHVLRLKDRPELMKKLDRNADGKLDQTEWDFARERLEVAVREHHRQIRGSKVLGFQKRQLFILSNYQESTLRAQFGFFAILKLIGGLAMTLGASATLLSQL